MQKLVEVNAGAVSVVVDEPQGAIYGGQVAAPAFQKIVAFAMPYLGIKPN